MSKDKQVSETEEDIDFEVETNKVVNVKLDINVGDKFKSFKEFQVKLDETTKANFVRYSKRDSRTLEAARRKTKRYLNEELEFYHLRYECFYAQKNRPRGTGKRNRKCLTREFEVSCPASISLKITDDGEFLEVYNIVDVHNHPVNEARFQKLLPKKNRSIFGSLLDGSHSNIIEEEIDQEDKYKIVSKKCRFIARLASVSSNSRVQEIIKNLDDYIYYLKYTASKEQMQKMKQEKNDEDLYEQDTQLNENNFKSNEIENADGESIKIIIETDPTDSYATNNCT